MHCFYGKANFTLKDYLYVNLTLKPERYGAYSMLSLLICFCMLISVWKNIPIKEQITFTIIFFLALFISMILTEVLTLYWKYRKNPQYSGEREFILSDKGIQIKHPHDTDDHVCPWEAIQSKMERKGFWILEINEKHSLVIPHSAFKKENHEAISLLIEKKVRNKKSDF